MLLPFFLLLLGWSASQNTEYYVMWSDAGCTEDIIMVRVEDSPVPCVASGCGSGASVVCTMPTVVDEIQGRYLHSVGYQYSTCNESSLVEYITLRTACMDMGLGVYMKTDPVGTELVVNTYTDPSCELGRTHIQTYEDGVCSPNLMSPMDDGVIYHYEEYLPDSQYYTMWSDDLCTETIQMLQVSEAEGPCVEQACVNGGQMECVEPSGIISNAEQYGRSDVYEWYTCNGTSLRTFYSLFDVCIEMDVSEYALMRKVGTTLEAYTYTDDVCSQDEVLVQVYLDGVCAANLMSPMDDGVIYHYVAVSSAGICLLSWLVMLVMFSVMMF